jgi:PAS domain S-box-containing protein
MRSTSEAAATSSSLHTVLIVENVAADRELYRRCLLADCSCRYTLLEADSATSAVSMCQNSEIDGILVDYALPDATGLEFVQELQSRFDGTHPPVVMVTSDNDPSIAVRAIKLGAEDYLIKQTLTPEQLQLAMQSAIENTRLRLQLRQSEERYRAIVDNQTELICRFLPDCTLTFVNQAYSRFFGSTPDQLVGQNFINFIPASDRPLVLQQIAELKAATPENAVLTHEHPVLKANGEIGWQRWTNRAIFNENGQLVEFQGVGQDISDRKRLEESLQQNEERLSLAIQAASMATWDMDMQTGRVVWSEAHFHILGYEPNPTGEATREMWQSRVHPDDLEHVLQSVEQATQRRSLYHSEHRIIQADNGEVRWLQAFGRVLYNDVGEAARFVGVFFEATDRKQAEIVLRDNETRLRYAQIASRTGVWDWDLTTNTVFWSKEYYILYGLDPTTSPSYENWLASILEKDREPADQQVRLALEQCQTEVNIEFRILHPTLGIRWFNARGQITYDANGQPTRMLGINLDITDRKQAEVAVQESQALFEAFMRYSPTTAYIKDAEGRYLYTNPLNEEICNRPLADWLGKTDFELFPIAEAQQWRNHDLTVLAEGRAIKIEETFMQVDGEHHFLSLKFPIFHPSGQQLLGGFSLDITDRKRAEIDRNRLLAEAQAAREEAEAANRSKDEVVAMVAHELRSPLNSIAGWAKLLQTRKFDEATQAKALETIWRNTQAQVQLVEDLLDISRMVQGTLHLNLAPVNLARVIAATLDLVRPQAEAKQIDVRVAILDFASHDNTHLPPHIQHPTFQVSGDFNRLQQIVVNLLTNAIKFTPNRGRVEIELSWVMGHWSLEEEPMPHDKEPMPHDKEPMPPYAQIQIRDTSKGIAPEFLPRIFDRFQQGQKNTGAKDGLGLGLAIVKNLVELHGGTIAVDSPGIGQGATFTVRLPLLNVSAPDYLEEPDYFEVNSLAGVRILVVDDEPDMLNLLTFVLESAHAEVGSAPTAAAALDLLPQFKPDILVSDIAMSGGNGYELVQHMRSHHPEGQIPAIALTAYASATHEERSLQAGFQQHLTKPVEPEVLVVAIARLVREARNSHV